MSVFQFRKTPLHRQGIPSRILAISPAIRDSTKVQNAVSTTSAESLAFFSSCASACARVSRWRSYSIVQAGDLPRWQPCNPQPLYGVFHFRYQLPSAHTTELPWRYQIQIQRPYYLRRRKGVPETAAFNRSRIHVENFGKFLFINLHETVSQ